MQCGAETPYAWLQYRWVGSLSDLERQRMLRNLEVATARFRDDFERELGYLQEAFDLGDERRLDEAAADCPLIPAPCPLMGPAGYLSRPTRR